MKSSITNNKTFGTNFKTVVAQAAIGTTEKSFTLGRKKPKTFTKVVHFSSKNGWLSPASAGYEASINEDYRDYKLKIESGQAGRMFTIIFDDKGNPVVVINASAKNVPFSEEEKLVTPAPKRNKSIIGKAMQTLNQMVDGVVLNGELYVSADGEIGPLEVVEDDSEVLAEAPPSEKLLRERAGVRGKVEDVFLRRSLKLHCCYSLSAFNLGSPLQGGVKLFLSRNELHW